MRLICGWSTPNRSGGGTSRGHFFSAAAEAMRRILVEHARGKSSRKRGGDYRRVSAGALEATSLMDPDLLIDIHEGIIRLAEEDPKLAELVKLRLFAGLSTTEAGEMLGMTRDVAYQNWKYIRTWFAARGVGEA
jgi:RNA polymerase sigma factor (TIGR02999 family)